MKKLTYNGKDVKVVESKNCENCIFDYINKDVYLKGGCDNHVIKFEQRNHLINCAAIKVKYLYK